ncbi:hypothetical protein [Planococcus sp. 4-30]|uniref:hypothetical protein n=1 Tax=Planococcus sp. 4-30 TaxID=2874583 RepID=UPI001CBF60CA|nr:hypothetical protein [Planococcus sp. 4-30]
MSRSFKAALLIFLLILFVMPWYNSFDRDLNGFTIPLWERIDFLFILYLAPIFALCGLYTVLRKKEPGIFYFLSGVPITLFWLFWLYHFINGISYIPWQYSYIWGKTGLFLSLLILFTSFIPTRSDSQNSRTVR